MNDALLNVLNSIVANATPLVIAGLGETITERAGVTNLSLDGSLALSAMLGFVAALATGNILVGLLVAMLAGALVAFIVAFAGIELKQDQVAVGFVLTLLGALFLALSKRRAELVALADGGADHRRSLADYSPQLLDQLISIVAASTLLAYAFYTISPETVAKFGTDRLLFTMPFLLYGIFRYLFLIHQREGGADPSETLLQDRPILACVALWAVTVAVLIYGPWR